MQALICCHTLYVINSINNKHLKYRLTVYTGWNVKSYLQYQSFAAFNTINMMNAAALKWILNSVSQYHAVESIYSSKTGVFLFVRDFFFLFFHTNL